MTATMTATTAPRSRTRRPIGGSRGRRLHAGPTGSGRTPSIVDPDLGTAAYNRALAVYAATAVPMGM